MSLEQVPPEKKWTRFEDFAIEKKEAKKILIEQENIGGVLEFKKEPHDILSVRVVRADGGRETVARLTDEYWIEQALLPEKKRRRSKPEYS